MDYAAGAPVFSAAQKEMNRAEKMFANPSSIHADGVLAKQGLQGARKTIADILHSSSDEIIFTGSGTESVNLAIMGVFKHFRLNNDSKEVFHIITTNIEHSAVLEACRHLEKVGAEVTYLSVDEKGLINLKEFRAALRSDTMLVSIGYVNNEIGTVQPIREIAKEIRHWKKQKAENKKQKAAEVYPLLHTDACQAVAYLNVNVQQLGVDLLSWNSTKLGGPHGVGALFVSRGVLINPLLYGGGQERGLRSGTENVAGAIGLATAFSEAEKIKEKDVPFLQILQSYFISEIQGHFPEARINGSLDSRVPNNVHVSFPDISSELLVLELDAKGISASAGSACDSAKDVSSHVLEALYGKDDTKNWGSVRFSFGYKTTKKEINAIIRALDSIFEKYRNMLK
jgi:cysteine desulfurase